MSHYINIGFRHTDEPDIKRINAGQYSFDISVSSLIEDAERAVKRSFERAEKVQTIKGYMKEAERSGYFKHPGQARAAENRLSRMMKSMEEEVMFAQQLEIFLRYVGTGDIDQFDEKESKILCDFIYQEAEANHREKVADALR